MRSIFRFDTFDVREIFPPFLRDGILVSVVMHGFLIIIMMASPFVRLTNFTPKIKYDEPIIVDLKDVVVGKQTILPPPPKEIPAPAESARAPEGNAPEAEAAKVETASPGDVDFKAAASAPAEDGAKLREERIGAVGDLLASVDRLKDASAVEIKKGIEAAPVEPAPGYRESATANILRRQFSISYIDAVRMKLRGCWNVDPGAKGIKDMRVVIRAELSSDGNVNGVSILNDAEYKSSPWFRAVADGARRAVLVCSPYSNLPPDLYDDWKSIVFTFYPDKKSVQ